MNRVMIVGQPGSGKSTLARHLGDLTGLPVVHVDRIHHLPGWKARPREEKIALALASHATPQWIFEGGLSATYGERLARADTLIVLDLPLWLRAWRVFLRTIVHYGRTRPDMADGCPERFDGEFWRWIWDTRHSARRANFALIERAGAGTDVIVLRSPAAVRRWLRGLDNAAGGKLAEA